MKKMLSIFFLALAVLVGAGLLAFIMIGPQRTWEQLFGDADMGTVDFQNIRRSKSGNDALACPKDFCNVPPDMETPVYAIPATHIRDRFRESLEMEKNIKRVHLNDAALQERYVQYSPTMQYPDTLAVQFVELPDKKSSIALFSRAKLGRKDFDANRKRIVRILDRLKQFEVQD